MERKTSLDSYLCFQSALLHSVLYFFFLYQSPSSFLCMVFDAISSSIGEVLLINPSVNVFVFEDLNVHHKKLREELDFSLYSLAQLLI